MIKQILNWIKGDFNKQHLKIKIQFAKAINEAKELDSQIQNKLKERENEILNIQKDINSYLIVKTQNTKFIDNLTKIIE